MSPNNEKMMQKFKNVLRSNLPKFKSEEKKNCQNQSVNKKALGFLEDHIFSEKLKRKPNPFPPPPMPGLGGVTENAILHLGP